MAILIRPELINAPFRVLAEQADVALGTVGGCLNDLAARRILLDGKDGRRVKDRQRTHFFRAEETEIYAPLRVLEDRDTQKALVAQPAARGGNLLVIEPPGPLAMPGAPHPDFPVAPDLLAYAELRYRGTEQALEAAELLLPRVLDHAAN